MDISALAPTLAAMIGVQPATLVLLIVIVTTAARAISRVIPDDATGWLGIIRRICTVLGVDVSNRITSGVTVTDVAKAALATPPIPEKVADDAAKGA